MCHVHAVKYYQGRLVHGSYINFAFQVITFEKKIIKLILKLKARHPHVYRPTFVTPPFLLSFLVSEGFSLGDYQILSGLNK